MTWTTNHPKGVELLSLSLWRRRVKTQHAHTGRGVVWGYLASRRAPQLDAAPCSLQERLGI
eukprot:2488946-Pleurochrysis_carterae.AAC.1